MPGEAEVLGCRFPLHLSYDVANHVWYEELPGGLWRLGITSVAVALANFRIFAFTPRRPGREVERGRSCGTIESSKWVGPVRIAFDAVVEAVNEAAEERPSLITADPYRAGWMLVARPSGPVAGLVTGDALAGAYAEWMRANDFPGCGSLPG